MYPGRTPQRHDADEQEDQEQPGRSATRTKTERFPTVPRATSSPAGEHALQQMSCSAPCDETQPPPRAAEGTPIQI